MLTYRRWPLIPVVLLIVASAVNAQGPAGTPSQAAPFVGPWVFTMTEPAHLAQMLDESETIKRGIGKKQ